MGNSAKDFVAERVNRSYKNVVAMRGEVAKGGEAKAKAEPREEDESRMRRFYEYCERMIAAQYSMWKKNGNFKH